MNRTVFIAALALGMGIMGCATPALPQGQDALLVNPSPETRAEITGLVSKILDGRTITIARDSLTKNSRLIIERRQSYGPNGYPAAGRDVPKPDHFYLRSAQGKCQLFHVQTGKSYPLSMARCRLV